MGWLRHQRYVEHRNAATLTSPGHFCHDDPPLRTRTLAFTFGFTATVFFATVPDSRWAGPTTQYSLRIRSAVNVRVGEVEMGLRRTASNDRSVSCFVPRERVAADMPKRP
mgnify:CR=1 FL=1